jgi:DNA polymerase III subunit epsilon
MYLFFDTETTGLITFENGQKKFPYIVELACLLSDDKGDILEQQSWIIKPNGYLIPIKSSNIHGITQEIALAKGVELHEALNEFSKIATKANAIVAHNIQFDEPIIANNFESVGLPNPLHGKIKICTLEHVMKEKSFLLLFFKNLHRVSLKTLHHRLFGTNFINAHSALNDTEALYRCFWELKKRKKLILH